MHFDYVLYSLEFDRYYIGLSSDVDRRLKQHNSGHTKSTKAYIPWRVVHKELCNTMIEARTRGKYLKSSAGRRWRKNNINLGD